MKRWLINDDPLALQRGLMTTPYLYSGQTALLLQVKKDLFRHEAFREFAYPDPLSRLAKKYKSLPWGFEPARGLLSLIKDMGEEDGKPWTVGVGNTHGVTPYTRVSMVQAERKLEEHIILMDEALSVKLSWYKGTSFVTKTILINMAFNLGLAGLLGFHNTLRLIGEKNYAQAAINMKLSLWFRQVGARAEELVERMATQTIPSKYKAPERI